MSIYVINNWSSATTYSLNDIVRQPADSQTFYYSTRNNNTNNTPSASSSFWGGISSFNGVTKPIFIWKPSYPVRFPMEPNTNEIKFGQGYSQRIPETINNNLLRLELNFDLRDLNEHQAIAHFLDARKGAESFLYTPPAPFNLQKLFICKTWQPEYIFKSNYNLTATFMEVAI